MISNQVLQSTIDSLKGITRVDIAISDVDGKILATTFNDEHYTEKMVASFCGFPGGFPGGRRLPVLQDFR